MIRSRAASPSPLAPGGEIEGGSHAALVPPLDALAGYSYREIAQREGVT